MPSLVMVCVALGLATAAAGPAQAQSVQDLRPGDPAPAFSLPGTDGRVHSLADHKSRQAVVLGWFSKAFTGG